MERQEELNKKKESATELLKLMDAINTKDEFAELLVTLVVNIQNHADNPSTVIEIAAIIANMAVGLKADNTIKLSARNASDATEKMYKGMFEIMQMEIDGKKLDFETVFNMAKNAATD